MIEQIKIYVHDIFAPYRGIKSARELEEELILSLTEKFNDFKQQGYSDGESYKWTIDSIGEVSVLVESIDPHYNAQKEGIYGSFSNGIMAASVYVIFFVTLMLVFEGTIIRDLVTLPAAALLLSITLVQYIVKGNSRYPRWLVLGSFITSIIVAVVMTVIFH